MVSAASQTDADSSSPFDVSHARDQA